MKLGKTVGEGTFGKVRIASHMPTNMKVAVKTLEKEKINDQADIQRVTREICILKMLHHPNIAQLYEVLSLRFRSFRPHPIFILSWSTPKEENSSTT
jgi:serine/threonine protein kinase